MIKISPMADIFSAAKSGNQNDIRELLEGDATLASDTQSGVSALMTALYHGHRQAAELISQYRNELTTHEASALGDIDQLRLALASHPESRDQHSEDGFTPLGFAAYFGQLTALDLLLQLGANPNIRSSNALSVAPLHSALAGGQTAVALLLIESGADPNLANHDGWTALHYCADIGDAEIALLLLENGADAMLRDTSGMTAAELAVEVGHDHVADAIFEFLNQE